MGELLDKLIFLDEPTVAVDPQSRNSILEGIQKLNREGATVVYTSHYMEEVEQICTRIMIMDKGKAVAVGTKEELKAMIGAGEKVTAEIYRLDQENLAEIRRLAGVRGVSCFSLPPSAARRAADGHPYGRPHRPGGGRADSPGGSGGENFVSDHVFRR